jgi:4-carboxymuconolactone decarboxylase
MNSELLLQGLAVRREMSSQVQIDEAFADPHICVQSFEEYLTEQYWGECWSDTTLDYRERSLLGLGIAAATGRMADFSMAVETAVKSGISEMELDAALRQIAVTCGISIGAQCVKIASDTLARADINQEAKSDKKKKANGRARRSSGQLAFAVRG